MLISKIERFRYNSWWMWSKKIFTIYWRKYLNQRRHHHHRHRLTSSIVTPLTLSDTSPFHSLSSCPYRSIFASHVVREHSRNKYSHRTMGPAEVRPPDPCHPLRRRQHYNELPKGNFCCCCIFSPFPPILSYQLVMPFVRPHRLPPIPKADQQRLKPLRTGKDYIRENIAKITTSLPICPRRYIVSDRKGNKFLIDGSGLQKDFIYKKVLDFWSDGFTDTYRHRIMVKFLRTCKHVNHWTNLKWKLRLKATWSCCQKRNVSV